MAEAKLEITTACMESFRNHAASIIHFIIAYSYWRPENPPTVKELLNPEAQDEQFDLTIEELEALQEAGTPLERQTVCNDLLKLTLFHTPQTPQPPK
jgi:hypothetical protein